MGQWGVNTPIFFLGGGGGEAGLETFQDVDIGVEAGGGSEERGNRRLLEFYRE